MYKCAYCYSLRESCDLFDCEPPIIRFPLCKTCSSVFQSSKGIRDYMLACIVYEKTEETEEKKVDIRDELWYTMNDDEMDKVNSISISQTV